MKPFYRFLAIIAWISLFTVAFISFGKQQKVLHPASGNNIKNEVSNPIELVKNLPGAADSQAKVYSVDKNNSELVVRLYKTGVFSEFGHNHVISAREFFGTAVFDEEDPAQFKLSVEVPTNSLAADFPETRTKYGMEVLGDKDRLEINKTMRSTKQLDIKKYPTIKFSSTGLKRIAGEVYDITGEFSLHGVTKTIEIPAIILIENKKLKVKGTFSFLQSDYNIAPFSGALGAIKNKDEVRLKFDISASEKRAE